MLNFFKSDRLAKAHQAIIANDREQLLKQLNKMKPNEVDLPVSDSTAGLIETCISLQRPKLLSLVLEHGATPSGTTSDNTPYAIFALKQEQSLSLLTALLTAGNNEDRDTLLKHCMKHSSEAQRMLHISLLLQHGATINDALLIQALELGERPLIHFLINSGAELPQLPQEIEASDETLSYAKQCLEDLRIRKMFL